MLGTVPASTRFLEDYFCLRGAYPLCAYLALCRRESILGRKGKPATLSLQVESNGCEVLKAKMLSEASSDRATTRRLSNTMSPGCQEN